MLDLIPEDGLILALKHSHEQALAGDTVTMDEVEQFMQDKIYELTVKNNRQDDSTIITRMNPRNLNGT